MNFWRGVIDELMNCRNFHDEVLGGGLTKLPQFHNSTMGGAEIIDELLLICNPAQLDGSFVQACPKPA
jgi:hypothetical protein